MGSNAIKSNLPFIDPGIGLSRNDLLVPLGIMAEIRNCDIHELGLGKRGGTSIFDNISGDPRITGLKQFISSKGDRYILRGTADGKYYKNNSDTIKAGLSIRGDEVLAEGDLATHAKWNASGSFDDTGGNLTYDDSSPSGPAVQLTTNFQIPVRPNKLYEFTYTVSGVGGSPSCIISLISTVGTALTLTNGTHTTQFTSRVDPGNMYLLGTGSGTLTDVFVLDDLSLKEVIAPPVDISDYQDNAIINNGVDVTQVYGGLRFLEAPSACVAGNAGNGLGSLSNGVYSYKITFVNANGETDGGLVSNEVDILRNAVDGQVKLGFIPIGPSEVTARKIYRTSFGGSTYLLLAVIENNITAEFLDNIADAFLGATIPTDNTATTGSTTTDLGEEGIEAPSALSASLVGASAPTAALKDSGTGVTAGLHSWMTVFVDADNVHTTYGSVSNVLNVPTGGEDVDLTDIAIGPAGTVKREIFRTETGDAGDYFEVGILNDNTTTIFSDNVDDADMGSNIINNGTFTPAGNWTLSGGLWSIGAGVARYTGPAGAAAEELIQIEADFQNLPDVPHRYILRYEVIANTNPGNISNFQFFITFENGIRTSALNKSVGTDELSFVVETDPPNRTGRIVSISFKITSTNACSLDLDNVSFLEIATPGVTIGNGTHNYKTTFVNAHGETQGGATSNTIVAELFNGNVNLSEIPVGPRGTIARKIYRSFIDSETPETALIAALAGAGAGNLDNDTYSYKTTFVNANGETLGSQTSNQITVADNGVDGRMALTSIPIGPPSTTDRKIYRTEGGGSVYKLAATINNNSTTTLTDNVADGGLGAEITDLSDVYKLVAIIGDNETTVYTDEIRDSSRGDGVPLSNTAAARPSSWIGTNNPKYALAYSAGNTEGLMLYGFTGTKNQIFLTADASFDFSDANILEFIINTGEDDTGIVGAVEYANRPIVFSKKKAWVIIKDDVDTANWTYVKAPWNGGTISNRTLVKVLDDVYSMAQDGNIYKISTVQAFGDYKTRSLTRATGDKQFDFNRWIQQNVDFDFAEDFHAEFNSELRAVFFWVVRNGQTEADTALIYFVDYDRWLLHDNRDFNSGYSASVSTVVKNEDGTETVYTGDYNGNVWKLGQSALNDNSNGYRAGFKTNRMIISPGGEGAKNIIDNRTYLEFFAIYEEIASQDFEVNAWVNGVAVGAGQIDMTDNYNNFVVKLQGRDIQVEMYNNTANEDFFLMALVFFVKMLQQ